MYYKYLPGSKNRFETNETCYGLNRVPKKDVDVLIPCGFMNANLLENRVFADVTTLR